MKTCVAWAIFKKLLKALVEIRLIVITLSKCLLLTHPSNSAITYTEQMAVVDIRNGKKVEESCLIPSNLEIPRQKLQQSSNIWKQKFTRPMTWTSSKAWAQFERTSSKLKAH